MSNVYYGVEPYTGRIIRHDGLGKASPFRLTEKDKERIKREAERRKSIDNMKNKIGSPIGVIARKWGFTKGKPNGKRKAKGKYDPSTGRFIYGDEITNKYAKQARVDAMTKNAMNNYYVERDRIATDGNIYTDLYDITDIRPGDRIKSTRSKR